MSHFEGHFEGAKTFLRSGQFRGQKSRKNYVPKFLKQRDIGNFMYPIAVVYCCCVLLSVVVVSVYTLLPPGQHLLLLR
jgi:hypothetical protein